MRIGPTGRFPRGKLRKDDEGELTLAVAVNGAKRVVELHFGTPITWIGLAPDDADALGQTLIARAADVRKLASGG